MAPDREQDLDTGSASSVAAVRAEFLAWVARFPRTEADVMDAWQSHCPRYTVWEDALAERLVVLEREPGMQFGEARVRLTPQGRAALPVG
jgi:hypothetical protein